MTDEVRLIDANSVCKKIVESIHYAEKWANEAKEQQDTHGLRCAAEAITSLLAMLTRIHDEPTIEAEPDKGWISVNDRLPDENQKCLVYRDIDNDLKITTGIWHSDRKTFDGLRHGTRIENTIAWMPLPEPPKDGDSK